MWRAKGKIREGKPHSPQYLCINRESAKINIRPSSPSSRRRKENTFPPRLGFMDKFTLGALENA
jgi:hypothetical protein